MVVYTVGTFDLLHVGHVAFLEHCRRLGSVVAVGVASDRIASVYKSSKPVIPLEQRMQMLRALRCVDIVRPYFELEYISGCEALGVDIFVAGEGWGQHSCDRELEKHLKSKGCEIVKLKYDLRTSSTQIRHSVRTQVPLMASLQHLIAAV